MRGVWLVEFSDIAAWWAGWSFGLASAGCRYDACMKLDGYRPSVPGLFVTGTDTDVGKTVVSCAIALAMRHQRSGARVGVSKPFASGCRKERGGLVADDTQALAHFSDCRVPLDDITPVRFREPLAPAVAAQLHGQKIDWDHVARAMQRVDEACDVVIVEGVGGVMVPLDPEPPGVTILDLARAIGYPVVVVARSGLGTLNHTALSVAVLRGAGLRIAGIVMNDYMPDDALAMAEDPSRVDNRAWLSNLTGCPVLAVAPRVQGPAIDLGRGVLDASILESIAQVDWWSIAAPTRQA